MSLSFCDTDKIMKYFAGNILDADNHVISNDKSM